jgi:hypothetical protein
MAIDQNNDRQRKSGADHPIDCGKIHELLFAYMSHELGEGQAVLVHEHLRHCKTCSEEALKIQRTLDLLKSHDPAESVAAEFSPKRRRRLIWMMAHPLIAKCIKHHIVTSLVIAVVFVAALLTVLLLVWRRDEQPRALPPVIMGAEKPDASPPPQLEHIEPYDPPQPPPSIVSP